MNTLIPFWINSYWKGQTLQLLKRKKKWAVTAKAVHGAAPQQRGFGSPPSSWSQAVPKGKTGSPPNSRLNEELLGTFTSFDYQPGETNVMPNRNCRYQSSLTLWQLWASPHTTSSALPVQATNAITITNNTPTASQTKSVRSINQVKHYFQFDQL